MSPPNTTSVPSARLVVFHLAMKSLFQLRISAENPEEQIADTPSLLPGLSHGYPLCVLLSVDSSMWLPSNEITKGLCALRESELCKHNQRAEDLRNHLNHHRC